MIDLLKKAKYGQGKYIDIAKGKYKLPENFKELKKWLLKKISK